MKDEDPNKMTAKDWLILLCYFTAVTIIAKFYKSLLPTAEVFMEALTTLFPFL